MPLPFPIPTDSLYKALAFGGVALMIGVAVAGWQKTERSWDRDAELLREHAQLYIELDRVARQYGADFTAPRPTDEAMLQD